MHQISRPVVTFLFGMALLRGFAGETATPADPVAQLAAEVKDQGSIVFSSYSQQGGWDIAVCRPDGSGHRLLTSTSEFSEFSPLVSPDGRKLLYRRVPRTEKLDNNRHGEQGELMLANSDGSEAKTLGKSGEWSWASWSPDGRQIASLSIKGVAFVDLATMSIVRSFPRKGFFQQMTWSPDGRWLSGVANSFGASWSVARMDATTGEATAINRVDCCTPDWFPDSQNVIFSWRPPGQKANKGYGWTQLWRADAEGKTRQLVYGEDGRHVYGGNVSPDGKYVLFTGNMQEDGDPGNAGAPMALMRLSDGPIICGESKELRSLHPNTKDGPVLALPNGWEPCWTAAILSGKSDDERPERKLGTPRSEADSPALLAAELRGKGSLVFSSRNDRGDWDLFLTRPDGSERRKLTDTPEFNEAGAKFSPDGNRLLYYRMPKGEPVDNNTYGTYELVVAAADGSNPVALGNKYQWATWGPDSRRLACLATNGIQIFDSVTRETLLKLPRKGIVEQLTWSPDGKWFVGTANGLGPFWNVAVMDLEKGNILPVSETDRYNCTPDWMPDSEYVVYARGIIPQKGGRAELWSARRDGTERRRIYAEAGFHIYGACASPDGAYLLFTRSSEDLGKVLSTTMAIIRCPKGTQPGSSNASLRLDLGAGWEPHWTLKQI